MNDSQLRRLLAERSPWRAREAWEADDRDLRAAGRLPLSYEPEPLADVRAPGLYVLRGPRRVGKSLELKRAVVRLLARGIDPKTIFYCSCDGLSGAGSPPPRRAPAQNAARTLPGAAPLAPRPRSRPCRGWSARRSSSCATRTPSSARPASCSRDPPRAICAQATQGSGRPARQASPTPTACCCRWASAAFCQRAWTGFGELPPPRRIRPTRLPHPPAPSGPISMRSSRGRSALDGCLAALSSTVGGFPRAVGELVRQRSRPAPDSSTACGTSIARRRRPRHVTMSDADVAALLDPPRREPRAVPSTRVAVARETSASPDARSRPRAASTTSSAPSSRGAAHRHAATPAPAPAAQRKLYFVDPLVAHLAAPPQPDGFPAPGHRSSSLNEQQIGLAPRTRTCRFDRARGVRRKPIGVMYERTGTGAEIDFVGPRLWRSPSSASTPTAAGARRPVR